MIYYVAVKQPTKGDIEMGMDSYLHKTTKENHSKYLVQCAKHKEIHDEFQPFCDGLVKKYGEEFFHQEYDEIVKSLTSEELDYVHNIQRRTQELKTTDDEIASEEIAYWRKAWGMHKFICRLTNTTGTGADCERIVLSKEQIETILAELKRCLDDGCKDVDYDNNPFGKDVYWDENDVFYTIEVFTNVLNNYDENTVIYYWCWA
jgi:hypothetical protein